LEREPISVPSLEPGCGLFSHQWHSKLEPAGLASLNAVSSIGAIMPGHKPLITAVLVILMTGYAGGFVLAEDTQTPAASQPADHPAGNVEEAPSVTVLNNHEAGGILGREVLSAANENMGRIVDVIVDRSGRVRAAIIDFGGFLGVGSRKIAVEWNALHFPPPGQADAKITLDLTRDQVKAAPEYQDGKPIVVLGALGKLEPLPFE
jgi:PRC-barrel domain